MAHVRSALTILAQEARRRKTTYGKLVNTVSEAELARVVHMEQLKDRLRVKWEGRGMACGQCEEVSDEQGAAGSS